jgi:hypothetical protein
METPWIAGLAIVLVVLAAWRFLRPRPTQAELVRRHLTANPPEPAGAPTPAMDVMPALLMVAHREARSAPPGPPPPPAKVQYALISEHENGRPAAAIDLTQPIVRIGRHQENDIYLGHASVHRYHALLRRDVDGAFEILDLTGADGNGVLVNGRRRAHAALREGDVIDLGDVRLRYVTRDRPGMDRNVWQRGEHPARRRPGATLH